MLQSNLDVACRATRVCGRTRAGVGSAVGRRKTLVRSTRRLRPKVQAPTGRRPVGPVREHKDDCVADPNRVRGWSVGPAGPQSRPEGARPNAFQQVFNAAADGFGPHVRAGAVVTWRYSFLGSRGAWENDFLTHWCKQSAAQSPPTARFAKK